MSPARGMALIIALIALLSISLSLADDVLRAGLSVPAALLELSRFFTILTNALVVVTLARFAMNPVGVSSEWLCALMLSIAMVGAVYWGLLAGINTPEGLGIYANQGLHTIVPIAFVLWWLACAPKAGLGYVDVAWFAAWPLLYVSYALTRAQIDGRYPYPFLDVNALGWGPVMVNIGELSVALLGAGLLVVIAVRFFTRRRSTA